MAKKKRAEKPQREMTRRQLSHWQRQRRRQRFIFGGGIFIIAAVILIVVVGWYTAEYRPTHRTVIAVNDTEFNMGYYIDTLRISGQGQSPEYLQSVADIVVREIEQNELVKQGAMALGVTVSNDEARKALEGSTIPVSDASLDLVRTQLLRDKLIKVYFETQVPASDKQVHIMAMLLESERQASEIRARLLNSENFTALAEDFSLNTYSKDNKGDPGWHPESILAQLLGSNVPGEYAFGSEAGTLSQPRYDADIYKGVGYWLVRVQERENIPDVPDAQVQAVLLGSEQEAQDIRARLEAGEDLAPLAKEHSQYEESRNQGGELGVVAKRELSPPADEYIFNPQTEVGVWSEPILDNTVETKGGYWLINVLEKDDDRKLDTNDRNVLLNQAFQEWASSLWLDPANKVESYLEPDLKTRAIEEVTQG